MSTPQNNPPKPEDAAKQLMDELKRRVEQASQPPKTPQPGAPKS